MSALTDGYVDSSQIGANHSEAFSNKIRAELDRSISKHLEAGKELIYTHLQHKQWLYLA